MVCRLNVTIASFIRQRSFYLLYKKEPAFLKLTCQLRASRSLEEPKKWVDRPFSLNPQSGHPFINIFLGTLLQAKVAVGIPRSLAPFLQAIASKRTDYSYPILLSACFLDQSMLDHIPPASHGLLILPEAHTEDLALLAKAAKALGTNKTRISFIELPQGSRQF